MKLRQLYNEIKMIPPNRILLKKYKNNKGYAGDYYFLIDGKNFGIYKSELNSIVKFGERYYDLLTLGDFLKSKKILYNIKRDKDGSKIFHIDPKYFIVPDKLNEVKLLSLYYLKVFNLALKIKSNIVKISKKSDWEETMHYFSDLFYEYGINSPSNNDIKSRFGQELKLLSEKELKELYKDLNTYFKDFI